MWIVEYRAMTPEERVELEDLLESGTDRPRSVLGAVLGGAMGLSAAVAMAPGFLLPLAAAAAGGILGWSGARALCRRRMAAFDRALRQDLEDGKVQVLHVAPDEVVRLREPGGVLAGYVAAIGDGQLLFMEPRAWGDDRGAPSPESEHLFPSRRFSVIRAPLSGVDLGLVSEGERFPPTREIEVDSPELLEDGEILQTTLDGLGREL